jgi:hypothetical protein
MLYPIELRAHSANADSIIAKAALIADSSVLAPTKLDTSHRGLDRSAYA